MVHEEDPGAMRGAESWLSGSLWRAPTRPQRPMEDPGEILRCVTVRAVLRGLSLRPGATPGDLVAWTGASWNAVDAALRRLRDAGLAGGPYGTPSRSWFAGAPLPAFCLHGAALRLLEAVHLHPGATAGRLSRVAGLPPAEVSRHGTRLEEQGWLCRVHMGRSVHYLPAPMKTFDA